MNRAQEFITKAIKKHGDYYDYSKVNYINNHTKVIIICKKHGEFLQAPVSHSGGRGCPECGKERISKNRKYSPQDFINKANKVHEGFYLYSKVNYINSLTKVTITCPIHGDFEQKPAGHLSGRGCPVCRYIKSGKNSTKSNDQFIAEAKSIHGNKYDYSKTKYVKGSQKIVITCPTHGDFEQTPTDHLAEKGCRKCANLYKPTTEEYIQRAIDIHGTKFDYSKVEYVNMHKKITIICPEHGEFEQSPRDHLKGTEGCPKCALNGFSKVKPGLLYYLKITTKDKGILYKIGITNRTVKERFNLVDLRRMEVLCEAYYKNGEDAYNQEQKILKECSKYKYTGENILQCGNTELFTEDVLSIWGKTIMEF